MWNSKDGIQLSFTSSDPYPRKIQGASPGSWESSMWGCKESNHSKMGVSHGISPNDLLGTIR